MSDAIEDALGKIDAMLAGEVDVMPLRALSVARKRNGSVSVLLTLHDHHNTGVTKCENEFPSLVDAIRGIARLHDLAVEKARRRFVRVVAIDEGAGLMTIQFEAGHCSDVPIDVLDHPECAHVRPPKIGDEYPWSAEAGTDEFTIHFAKGRRA